MIDLLKYYYEHKNYLQNSLLLSRFSSLLELREVLWLQPSAGEGLWGGLEYSEHTGELSLLALCCINKLGFWEFKLLEMQGLMIPLGGLIKKWEKY